MVELVEIVDTTHEKFDSIEAYDVDTLKVSPVHTLYYEQSGNPNGVPVVFLHGGPGSGVADNYREFFDPEFYRIIMFDQRGAGKSTPHASLEDNTTWDLVEDIEKLRDHLDIDNWMVFGGSWGSTLAIAYSTEHPQAVSARILRGIFLCRTKEIDGYYEQASPDKPFGGHAARHYPDEWQRYLAVIPEDERANLVNAYGIRLRSEDPAIQLEAARAWTRWEGVTSKSYTDPKDIGKFNEDKFAIAFARIENHYFRNGIWVSDDNFLLERLAQTQHIPTRIISGRHDYVCPPETSFEAAQALNLPKGELIFAGNSGHSMSEKVISSELVKATEDFKAHLS